MNYQESTVAGTSWVRANRIQIDNPLNSSAMVNFTEEKVVVLETGDVFKQYVGEIQERVSQENMSTEFPLINPETGEDTGMKISYAGVYASLHSLYMHLATKRDAPNIVPSE